MLYASVDQGPLSKHSADLKKLRPLPEELRGAGEWCRTQDPSDGFAQQLELALRVFGGFAGLFRAARVGNRVRFSWQRWELLSALLAPLPDVIPVWSSRLRVTSGFLDLLTRTQAKSDRLVGVEAARCLGQLSDDLQALGVELPDLPAMTRDGLASWVLSTTERLVRSDSQFPEVANKARRTRWTR